MTSKQHSEPTYWRDDPTTGEIEPDPEGDWVLRGAYEDLEEQLEALQTAVDDGVLVFVDTKWFDAYHHLANVQVASDGLTDAAVEGTTEQPAPNPASEPKEDA